MNRKKISYLLFTLLSLVIFGFLLYKNWKTQDFWKANFMQIITFMLASFISFLFVQKQTDKRRKVDCFLDILVEIQTSISHNDNIFSINSESLLLQRALANKILFLCEKSFPEISSDLDYINKEFNEMRELYDNHKSSEDDINSITMDLKRHQLNITTKCDKVRLALFDI